jgi:hypothetical protein
MRAAVGGWMTARWSGVLLEPKRQQCHGGARRISMPNAGGFTHGARTGSPEVVFLRVHVMRSVGCRSWFEASWRGVRAEPRGETRRNVERV